MVSLCKEFQTDFNQWQLELIVNKKMIKKNIQKRLGDIILLIILFMLFSEKVISVTL